MSDAGTSEGHGDPAPIDHGALAAAVRTLHESRFSAPAGDGRVTATVSGAGTLLEVDIDPLLEPHHLARLAGWLETAIHAARAAAREHVDDVIGPVVGDREAFVESAATAVPWLNPGPEER